MISVSPLLHSYVRARFDLAVLQWRTEGAVGDAGSGRGPDGLGCLWLSKRLPLAEEIRFIRRGPDVLDRRMPFIMHCPSAGAG